MKSYAIAIKTDWPLEPLQTFKICASTKKGYTYQLTTLTTSELAALRGDKELPPKEDDDPIEVFNIKASQFHESLRPFQTFAEMRATIGANNDLIKLEIEKFLEVYPIESTQRKFVGAQFRRATPNYPAHLESREGIAVFWWPHQIALGATKTYFSKHKM